MNKEQAKDFIKQTLENSFDKEQFKIFAKNVFNTIDEAGSFIERGNYIPESFRTFISSLERIGKYSDGENEVDILIVKLKKETSIQRARSMQRNFIARYLNGSHKGKLKDAALVAFVSPDESEWRLSLVKMDYSFTENEKGKTKVKQEFTPSRRWSFLVGSGENSHTAQSRFIPLLTNDSDNPTLKELEDTFNIEKVTKEFFEKYRQLYFNLKESIDEIINSNSKLKRNFEENKIDTTDFSKKLLGQIVFLYFIQKKGWLGVAEDKKWGEGDKNFLRSIFNKAIKDRKNFFNEYLEILFYDTLNNPRTRQTNPTWSKDFKCKIPFLNGGLFEPIQNYDWENTNIEIPNELFSNDIRTKEGDTGAGILDVFDRYNFTVKEDEPLEKEVAVDPEMLGKVFENLLEVKDRKSKGTYYTPREIVHYMCQESLINYLYTKLNPDEEKNLVPEKSSQLDLEGKAEPVQGSLTETTAHINVSKEDLEYLIKHGESFSEHDAAVRTGSKTYNKHGLPDGVRKYAKEIDKALEVIKVCDPAIGSGAFPVAMMNEIVKARNVLSLHSGKGEANLYKFKRGCIENSIYGVDIDPGAIEIAKLRLWLSLVVDEDDLNDIQPLPNLDYKIVCGNSLLGVGGVVVDLKLLGEIEAKKKDYFALTSPADKSKSKKEIDSKLKQFFEEAKKNYHVNADFDFEINFSEIFSHEKKGFDVVIGNPPYVKARDSKDKEMRKLIEKQFHTTYGMWDLYIPFIEQGLRKLNDIGNLTMIIPETIGIADYSKKIIEFIERNCHLYRIDFFPNSKIFENAAIKNKIVFISKNFSNKNLVRTRHGKTFGEIEILSNIATDNKYHYEQNEFEINRINTLELSSVCFVSYGLRLNSHKEDTYYKFKKSDLISTTKSKLYKKEYTEGKYLSKYRINKILFLEWDSDRCPKRLVRPTFPELYLHPKLLLSRQKRIGAFNSNGCICDNTIVIAVLACNLKNVQNKSVTKYYKNLSIARKVIEKNSLNFELKYILSVINSSLIQYYIRKCSQGAIDFYPDDWKTIPIKVIERRNQILFSLLVDKIIKLKTENKNTTDLENRIDVMVYKLYELTYDEVKIIDPDFWMSEEEYGRFEIEE